MTFDEIVDIKSITVFSNRFRFCNWLFALYWQSFSNSCRINLAIANNIRSYLSEKVLFKYLFFRVVDSRLKAFLLSTLNISFLFYWFQGFLWETCDSMLFSLKLRFLNQDYLYSLFLIFCHFDYKVPLYCFVWNSLSLMNLCRNLP